MLSNLLSNLTEFIVQFGSLGVFLVAFIEEVLVPIPSALVMFSSGFFLLGMETISPASVLALFTRVALPLTAGLTLGSLVTYGLAYRYGRAAVERWGKYFAITWADIEQLERRLGRSYADELALFGFRLVPVIPSVVINIFCGFTRVSLVKYLVITFCGVLARAYLLAFAGWQLGGAYHRYSYYFDKLENLGLVLLALALAFFFYYQRRKAQIQSHV